MDVKNNNNQRNNEEETWICENHAPDVRLALNSAAPVAWHGVMPGLFIGADALTDPILRALKEKK